MAVQTDTAGNDFVAQLVAQLAFNQRVVSSSLTGVTTLGKPL